MNRLQAFFFFFVNIVIKLLKCIWHCLVKVIQSTVHNSFDVMCVINIVVGENVPVSVLCFFVGNTARHLDCLPLHTTNRDQKLQSLKGLSCGYIQHKQTALIPSLSCRVTSLCQQHQQSKTHPINRHKKWTEWNTSVPDENQKTHKHQAWMQKQCCHVIYY